MKKRKIQVNDFFKRAREVLPIRLLQGERYLRRLIQEQTVNRPGLALAGCMKYFAWRRVQVLGSAEIHYLRSLNKEERRRRCEDLFQFRIPCIVICRSLKPDSVLREAAEKAHIPIFQSPMVTMRFINQATILLEEMFAPEATVMGSMVDILGVGVLIQGESGIGKSECVLELIERGYCLVSDDVTRVRLSEEKKLIGRSPEVTFGMMEVRGIGIIDVRAMFGVRSIRTEKQIDLVVTLSEWNECDEKDRLGLEEEKIEILGVKLRHIRIPVRPGRDIARLVEVAAFDTKLRMMGMNPAEEIDRRVIEKMREEADRKAWRKRK